MKFDDAIQIIDGMTMISGGFGISPDVTKRIIEDLRGEYTPPVKMTKNDKDILLYNIENYSFSVFAENISLSDKEKFGLPANKEFQGLSIEDLMRAWLFPEIIKIVKE